MKMHKTLAALTLAAAAALGFNSALAAETPAFNDHKVLIAYFTWAENTEVADPASVDVDATTSASLLLPGNVGLLASWIKEQTDGTIFSIKTAEPYSSDYEECLDRAAHEHDNEIYPSLTAKVENLADYDVVFLGYPNWWYSCPMAILQFIAENDLSGKTIIPFCAHGTGGLAGSIRDIRNALPEDATLLEVFHVSRPEVQGAQGALNEWLNKVGAQL